MPIFGIDTSHFQSGISYQQARAEGAQFVIGKISQGSTFHDVQWPATREAARAAGLLVGGYHFIDNSAAAAQAANCAAAIGDSSIPVALDWEQAGVPWSQFLAVQQAMETHGLNVNLAYAPHWFWQESGSPDMSGCGLPLWASRYPSTTPASPTSLYAAVTPEFWAGYGGLDVGLLQFADSAQVAGMVVDCSAFLGGAEQLAELFGQPAPVALPVLEYGMRNNPSVAHLQAFLNFYNWRPALPLLPVTGNFLDQTAAVVKAAQAQMGVSGPDADGEICGPRTNAALWQRGYRG